MNKTELRGFQENNMQGQTTVQENSIVEKFWILQREAL